jgi:hypothetical protein
MLNDLKTTFKLFLSHMVNRWFPSITVRATTEVKIYQGSQTIHYVPVEYKWLKLIAIEEANAEECGAILLIVSSKYQKRHICLKKFSGRAR